MRNKTNNLKECLYDTASKMYIKYGNIDVNNRFKVEKCLHEFWRYSKFPPSYGFYLRNIKKENVKKYIRDNIKIQDNLWNSDFIHGISQCGKIRNSKRSFDSLYWYSNKHVFNILRLSPFNCKMHNNPSIQLYGWCSSPVLSMQYDDKSISYMAGVLATGKIYAKNGNSYYKYNRKTSEVLKQWNIPIEYKDKSKILIAPIWVLLFMDYMPDKVRKLFKYPKNSQESSLYAAILWNTYVGTNFRKDGIPYLQSRRTIFYKYNNINTLEKFRISKNMVELDIRIEKVVKMMSGKKHYRKEKHEISTN